VSDGIDKKEKTGIKTKTTSTKKPNKKKNKKDKENTGKKR
jgi:hypothetical protein